MVREHAISEECDYCKRRANKPIACELSDVIERIRWAIDQEYNDPNEELPWDEGEYCGTVLHGAEILSDIDFCIENTQLLGDIAADFWDDAFCKRDYFGPTEEDRFGSAWRRFKEVVQHQRRYTFWTVEDEGEFQDPSYGITAAKLLRLLGRFIDFLSPIDAIPVGTEIWRVREFPPDDANVNDPTAYTSPPTGKALQANRLSPPGISMFYGANDAATAFKETIDLDKTTDRIARAARFSTAMPLTLLDLSQIPRPESEFATSWDRERRGARAFLQAFADMLAQPIARDHKYHLEYVPTQVFTEFIRYELKTDCVEQFHGIKYKSSRRKGGICYVIFANQDACLPGPAGRNTPQLLSFVPGSVRTRSVVRSKKGNKRRT
ncbi:MAG TPA: HEPN-associated N-terminal domain-containing protein [Planctomycetaceae bacterium]|nr:HEPN-associated N-terminal domain-containing protein [Planctomycetaceae bacterium]